MIKDIIRDLEIAVDTALVVRKLVEKYNGKNIADLVKDLDNIPSIHTGTLSFNIVYSGDLVYRTLSYPPHSMKHIVNAEEIIPEIDATIEHFKRHIIALQNTDIKLLQERKEVILDIVENYNNSLNHYLKTCSNLEIEVVYD